MSALERFSDQEVLALARFILRHAAKSGSLHWRTRFAECARRGWFAPVAERGDESTLTSLYRRHGSVVLCGLRTKEVLTAANELSLVQRVGPLALSAVCDSNNCPIAVRPDRPNESPGAS